MVSPPAMFSHAEMVSPTENGQPRTEMVSPAASDGQPYAHAHVLKVQNSFDRPRSEVKGEGQPFCT